MMRNCIIGLNYYSPFLRSDGEEANFDDLYRHICRFLELGAEDCLALAPTSMGPTSPPVWTTAARCPPWVST